jgi:Mrp family chromosome partitioning ATPase
MSKMLDSFRGNGESRVVRNGRESAPSSQPDEDATTQAMPFIEIGPRCQVDGSPDVLAVPVPRPMAPTPTPAPAPSVATSRSAQVSFRSLPGQAPVQPPRRDFAPELVAYHAAGQPAAASYAELLETLGQTAHARRGADCKVYLFTAMASGIGATSAVLNLAITAARQGKAVVVVDANLRRPGVAAKVGLEDQPGLLEVLSGDCSLLDALRATKLAGLHILSTGRCMGTWVDAESLRDLCGELASRFDLVLVDGPCWEERSIGLLAGACEAVYLVVAAAQAEAPAVNRLVREWPRRGIPLAGCVLTAV